MFSVPLLRTLTNDKNNAKHHYYLIKWVPLQLKNKPNPHSP